jgi:hypothetical protein
MIRPIVRYGADVLHAPASPVGVITPEVQLLIDDMIQTMYAAPGIGLAAPQVGVPLRIFVADVSVGRNPADLLVFINPEFLERDGMQLEEEGCLSVPGFNATVARPLQGEGARPRSQRQRAGCRGHGTARTLLPARDGSPRRDALRRSLARPAEGPDLRKIKKLARSGKW